LRRVLGAALALASLAAVTQAAKPPVVLSGLDVIARDGAGALRGKRVGLIAHAASVTADGRASVDVLRAAGVEVVRFFAPEHGITTDKANGQRFKDEVDPRTGLPVLSLYGDYAGLKPAQVEGLDAVVYDLQDAGARFYTYESDLITTLEVVAAAGLELVVLDRPNPLGGERVEGPTADGVVPKSHVNRAPGPLVHGLTTGELARFVNARLAGPARLTVVPMQGWRRSMTWMDTGRKWVPPSPNLRTAEAALAYPGTCLIEATNVTEGRGTEAPFLLIGAPWVDPAALTRAVRVPGYALAPASFTSHAGPAAPAPKHKDQPCRGVRIRVTDRQRAQPYALGVTLLHALRRQPGFAWSGVRPDHLDWLTGTRALREALERGDSVDAILRADDAAIAAFREQRRPALLY
jgi:uncharacterized protein YbbC (DUF1343 family)